MNEQVFESAYAPLDPDGPLPPDLSERVVANAYKARNILPKRVLSELGIRKYSGTAAIRLREALDDSGNRVSLQASKKSGPLHQALYSFLRGQPSYRTVYERIVKPAEVQVNRSGRSVTEIDPTKFELRITSDQRDQSWSDHTITSQSEEEGLVLFALAYGLLQPSCSYDILKPVLAIGPAFSRYFGASVATARLDKSNISLPPSSDSNLQESDRLTSTLQSSQSTGNSSAATSRVILYTGPRSQRIRNVSQTLEERRVHRQQLAGASVLDKSAFDSAYAGEVMAVEELRTAEEEFRNEWTTLTSQFKSVAAEYGIGLSFGACPKQVDQLADSVDRLAGEVSEFAGLTAALEARYTAAAELGVRSDRGKNRVTVPSDSATAVNLIREQLAEATAVYERASHWRDVRMELETKLIDCTEVIPASSFMRLAPETILELIDHSVINQEWDALRPLLFRLWSERFGWNHLQGVAIGRIQRALESAAATGDYDQHAENLAFLTRDFLQELMATGNHDLTRHVVLASFRESLASRDDFFFSGIWGFERGWLARAEVLGERLYRFFTTLYQFFLRCQDAPLAFAVLGRTDAAVETSASEGFAAARIRDASDTAARLGETGNLPGLFGKLRYWSMSHHFRPLATFIRERRHSDVANYLHDLETRFQSGRLVDEVIDEAGGRHIRSAHAESVRRYIEDNIIIVRNWLARNTTRDNPQEEAELGDESLPLQRIATQLAREAAKGTPHSVPGSINWLEREIGHLITNIRSGAILVPLQVWLNVGDSPALGESTARALTPEATHVCSWAAYVEGQLTWRSLLQDQLAEHLFRVKRTLIEAVDVLVKAGKLEAALEAAKTGDATAPEFQTAIDKIQALLTWHANFVAEITSLDDRLTGLKAGAGRRSSEIEVLSSDLLALLDDLSKVDPKVLQSSLDTIRDRVTRLEMEITASGARRKELEDWLIKARVSPHGHTLEQLESLVTETRNRAAARRVHLLRLQDLDVQPTPSVLREGIRRVIRLEDRPDRWPSANAALEAQLYIDNFVTISSGWWHALEHIDRGDAAFERILGLAYLFERELEGEVRALSEGRIAEARLLTILAERSKWSVGEFLARLSGTFSGASSSATVEEKPISVSEMGVDELPDRSSALVEEPAFVPIWRERLQAVEVNEVGSGQLVERTFNLFGSREYKLVLQTAPIAWRWLKSVESPRDLDALMAVYAWAAVNVSPSADRERAEALGLIFRASRRLSERVSSLQESLPRWLTSLIEGVPDEMVTTSSLSSSILRLSESQRGSPERERFAILLRTSDSTSVVQFVWDGLRGSSDQLKVRTALLLLLFDLGDDRALHHLFAQTGDQHKYLIAFTALAKRATAEPSTRLLGAIQQNIRRLSQLKERPFRDYAHRIAARLRYAIGQVEVQVPSELDPDQRDTGVFRLPINVCPDEGDPPIRLSVELLPSEEYDLAYGAAIAQITSDGILLDSREVDFVIKPRTSVTGSTVALAIKGETASGNIIDQVIRRDVAFGSDRSYERISDDELLDIYAGYDGKPVSGAAFVGRENELEALERTLMRSDPGAVLLYGVRRLGKTSLLDELRRRRCLTQRPDSRTLFISVPVDQLSLTSSTKPFLVQFLQHIGHAVLFEDKNELLRKKLHESGVSRRDLAESWKETDELRDAPFVIKLRAGLRHLLDLSKLQVETIVLVFDEFDKLLEQYRTGLSAEVEELTSQLRHLATEEHGVGILLAGSELMQKIVGHYRNALFGSAKVVHLECFDKPSQRDAATGIVFPERLKGRRLFTEEGITEAIKITGGHPLYLRLLACAAVRLSNTRRVGASAVRAAVQPLLSDSVLPGYLPDVANLVRQPLQVLSLMDSSTRDLSELLLLAIARQTSLERSYVSWSVVAGDDRLLNIRQSSVWVNVRNQLHELKLILQSERGWHFTFPILGEQLRLSFEFEFDRIAAAVAAPQSSGGQ